MISVITCRKRRSTPRPLLFFRSRASTKHSDSPKILPSGLSSRKADRFARSGSGFVSGVLITLKGNHVKTAISARRGGSISISLFNKRRG